MDVIAMRYRELALELARHLVDDRARMGALGTAAAATPVGGRGASSLAEYCLRIVDDMARRRNEVVFNAAARGYVRLVPGAPYVRLTGLRRVMSYMLYDGDEDAASIVERRGAAASMRSSAATGATGAAAAAVAGAAPVSVPASCAVCHGGDETHGRLVHEQLEQLTTALRVGGRLLPLENYDRCAVSVLRALLFKGWLPLFGEYTVDDPRINVGTAIDIVAVDVRRVRIMLVEVKTGYSTRHYDTPAAGVRFRSPLFAALPATPYTQHAMQAVLGQALLETRYPAAAAAGLFESVVVRVSSTEDRTFTHPVPPSWGADPLGRAALYAVFSEAALARRRPSRRDL